MRERHPRAGASSVAAGVPGLSLPRLAGVTIDPAALALVIILATFAVTLNWWLLLAVPVVGYLVSWVGHFVFERNKPASFKQPLYSFMGDWKMFWQILTGKIAF